eukprot:297172-Pelagomonas_calceolata.AAC.1
MGARSDLAWYLFRLQNRNSGNDICGRCKADEICLTKKLTNNTHVQSSTGNCARMLVVLLPRQTAHQQRIGAFNLNS